MRNSLYISNTTIVSQNGNAESDIELNITNRELEVLQMMSKGLTTKEIASELYLSNHTILSHKKNLLYKFTARNAVDLAVKAIKYSVIAI